ncbi:MAG: RnfABCDGE type electron transport complex subunit G [Candidatus Lernaella stagnicola]|nr:RnfABCDGE type electron transport complex subunit G [Candidatus Lernaella stagnicola]
MNDLLKMTLVLTLICVVAAVALSQVYRVTKEPIAVALEAEAKEAAATVLGPVLSDGAAVDKRAGGPDGAALYVAVKDGQPQGFAFPVVSHKGYAGDIGGMLGVDTEGRVLGYKVVQHSETPGLGSHIQTNEAWLKQLVFCPDGERRTLDSKNTDWRVKKDGGDIDALTGATISPRAVTGSIKAGLEWFAEHRAELTGTVSPNPVEAQDAGPPTPNPKLEEGGVVDQKLPAAVALPKVEKTPPPFTEKTLTE